MEFDAMRASTIAILVAFPALVLTSNPMTAAAAETAGKDVKGLYLLTDYPALSVRPGTTSTVSMRLQNYGLAPERFTLSVEDTPPGWTATLLGGGQPVAAAMAATDQSVSLQLRLDVPANAGSGDKTLTVKATDQSNPANSVSLPITVSLAKELPAKLTVTPQLPSLRGSPKTSFDYTLSIKNDSGRNLVVSLAATAPRNFDTSFTEAYGSQELSSVPIDAGASKDVKLKVRPPSSVDAGEFPIEMTASAGDATAKAELKLQVVGTPRLTITGTEGLVSARATAGQQSTVPILIANDGTAPADNVELSGSGPSGWKIEFDRKTIDRIEPGKTSDVNALITPSEKSLAGDYMATIRAASRGETASTQFRVTVSTSTTWGMVGVGVIGVALLIMVGAVSRFGRR
jgi:uncharacterized membrane protein